LTQTGEVFGSPLYMSPEQCLGKKLDARSDIYSLGCVINEMLTGNPPFTADSAFETLMKHINGEPSLDSSLPQAIEDLILRALDKDVAKRYQSVAELSSALDAAESSLSEGGVRSRKRRRKAKTTSRWSKKERIVAWCLIPLCAVIAAAGAAAIASIWFKPEWEKQLNIARQCAQVRNPAFAKFSFARALTLAQQEHDGRAAESQVRSAMGDFYFSEAREYSYQADAAIAAKQMYEALKIIQNTGTAFQKALLLDNLGEVENFLHEYSAADDYYKDALVFRNQDPGPQGRLLGSTLERQGLNYESEKKYDLAEKSFLQAADVMQRGGENIYIVDCYRGLASIEMKMHKYQQAIDHFDQCIKLIKTTTGTGDPRLEEVLLIKVNLLDKLGKNKEADALRAQLK